MRYAYPPYAFLAVISCFDAIEKKATKEKNTVRTSHQSLKK